MKHTKIFSKPDSTQIDLYRLSPGQGGLIFAEYIIGILGVSLLFYDSPFGAFFLLFPAYFMLKGTWEAQKNKKKAKASVEFCDLLENISASLYAGVSLENSFVRSVKAVQELYGRQMVLLPALNEGISRLNMNVPVEQVFAMLAELSDIEDIRSFAALTGVVRKNGGNLIKIISRSCGQISEKLKLDQEIAAMLSAKRMEQNIMCIMPFGIILYMKLTSPGYFDVLYHNAFGIVFMSACLLVAFTAYIMGKHMIDITV